MSKYYMLVNVATNPEYWGEGWDALTEDAQEEEVARFERLCLKYGARETARVPELVSRPNRNTGDAYSIQEEAWDAWCRGEDA